MSEAMQPEELAGAVDDGSAVDWDDLVAGADPEDRTLVMNLSRVSRVMCAHERLVREFLPFETWGTLRLLEKIGEGGFGEVFRAWDESLGREVALKLFRQKERSDAVRATISEQRAKDLLLEARRLARVRHENVVRVYGAEEHRVRPGFWMELVEGHTIASELHSDGPMDADEAAAIGVRLCSGLSAIHRAGLLHRDIKAQNVMREADGRVVLTDMGAGVDLRFSPRGLPRGIAGTPLYMAPELLENEGADATADMYSLGVLLYHMVTGRYPHESHDFESLREDHRAGRRVPLGERRRELPTAFVDVVERATAHDPRNRFASAAAMEAALAPLARDTVDARARRTPPRVRIAVLLAIVLSAVAIGGALRDRLPGRAVVGAEQTDPGQIRRLTFSGDADVPAWSPDGRLIAYLEWPELRVMAPDGSGTRTLELPEGRGMVPWDWTPDSERILGHSYDPERGTSDILSVDAFGRGIQTVVENAIFPGISPDGNLIAYARRREGILVTDVWLEDLRTGDDRMIVEAQGEGTAVYKPKFTPDGERLTYVRWNGFGHELWVCDLDGENHRRIETGAIRPGGLYTFTDDGRHLLTGGEVFGVGSIWKIGLDVDEQIALTPGGDRQEHATRAADDAEFVFTRVIETSRLVTVDSATGATEDFARLDLAMHLPVMGSQGDDVFFQALVNGMLEIWTAPVDGSRDPRPVVRHEQLSCFGPAPAADGVFHLRGDVRHTSIFGEVRWPQELWWSSRDGLRHAHWDHAGDNVSRLAPSGERDGRVLYARFAPNGETYWIVEPDTDPRRIAQDDASTSINHFDWGRTRDEVVVLVHRKDLEGMPVQVMALDVVTGDREVLLDDEVLTSRLDVPGLRACRFLTSTRDGHRVELLLVDATTSTTSVVEFDRRDESLRLVSTMEDEMLGESLAASPDGSTLAVSLSEHVKDIYVWQKRRSPEVARAGR